MKSIRLCFASRDKWVIVASLQKRIDRFDFGDESLVVVGEERTDRTVPSYADPALVIAKENDAGELSLRMLLVGSYQRHRTIGSTREKV